MAAPNVTFTYTSGGKQIVRNLPGADMIASREGLGVWHVEAKAWKVFRNTNQLAALNADYSRAAVKAGLPMGNPIFQQGSVAVGGGQPTQGFVLIIEWMAGNRFLHTSAAFLAELRRPPPFPSARTSDDYKRMRAGAAAANTVGLQDPQGYLQPGIYEPLRFFDVHTSWNEQSQSFGYSGVAEEISNGAIAWGQ